MLRPTSISVSLLISVVVAAGFVDGSTNARGDDWPQWRGPKRDGVWRESGILSEFEGRTLKPLWSVPVFGGYSGPTVADGRVFLTDRIVKPKQKERVLCFSADSGKRVWTHEYECPYRGIQYDAGPRASVTIDDVRVYALGSMGHLHCLDAGTGEVRWKRDLNADYQIRMPIWGISAAPLVEGNLLIVQIGGANNACLVALDKVTGQEVWRALDDEASYSAPMIIEQAGQRVLVCYTGGAVVGLDPATGKLHWRHPFPPRRMVIGIADPVLHRDLLFVSNFFDGSLLLKLSQDKLAVDLVWQRAGKSEKETDSLHSIISTPYLDGDHIYGVDSYGELRCLELMTGDRVWESLAAGPKERWATIHFIKHQDHTWLFNEKGQLIIANLTPRGYEELSRAKLIRPTRDQLPSRRGGVTWSHPAFANKRVYARSDKELVCVDLSSH